MRSREEHLAWCKQRALTYLDKGDVKEAVTSMMSDLDKHPETRHAGEAMTYFAFFVIMQNSHADARRYIEGFN